MKRYLGLNELERNKQFDCYVFSFGFVFLVVQFNLLFYIDFICLYFVEYWFFIVNIFYLLVGRDELNQIGKNQIYLEFYKYKFLIWGYVGGVASGIVYF